MKWFLGVLVMLAMSQPARADIITPPSEGYVDSEEIGGVSYEREVETPPNFECEQPNVPPCRVVAVSVDWSPTNLPVTVAVRRTPAGYSLVMLARLSERSGRPSCWQRRTLRRKIANDARRLWMSVAAEFKGWARSCRTTEIMGVAPATTEFNDRRADFERGFERLKRDRIQPSAKHEEDMFGLTSFLPTKISQATLDAVAEACQGPSERLRLRPDGLIDWRFDGSIPYGPNHERPFDSCVDDQIRYFPGYRRQG